MPAYYPYLLDPTAYPDYTRRSFCVPTWKTFDNLTQLLTLRVFSEKDGKLVFWREDLDLYEQLRLGRVIWPFFRTMFAGNFKELVQEIKKRKLYLFDFWGHVPGSSMEGTWSHIMPPEGMVKYLEEELGDHFLGIDNGEQDGRYIGLYASQQCPSHGNRTRQYLNFQRHFERMGDDLGNHLSTLVSLSFGHYFLKEGNHVLIGAETAQALPNSQFYYAFIRGAGKQYGVHWFGNASVFNRWGFKTYESEGVQEIGGKYGPESGTSLNLLKRLLYTHYLYNSVAIGFEQSWIFGDNTEKRIENKPVPMETDRTLCTLTPVGVIQVEAGQFIERYGQPGIMHTPAALLLDFFAGWTAPRHLYTGNVFNVWGAVPYEPGDYLTHGVFSLLYPGYEDASYYRDERGFLSPTPYGDIADFLLSDVPSWVLRQYGLVVAAGVLTINQELRDKLHKYVEEGGELAVTGNNAGNLVANLTLSDASERIPANSVVRWSDESEDIETNAFDLYRATLPESAEVKATCNGMPAVVRIPAGRGAYTVFLSLYGINAESLVEGTVVNAVQTSLVSPYILMNHVRRGLGSLLSAQQLFSVGEELSLITCRKDAGEYTLGVHNNGLQAKPLQITSFCGPILSMTELQIGQGEKGKQGYWPTGFKDNDGGTSDDHTIAGGDIRLFSVQVAEEGVYCLPVISPPVRPENRLLTLRGEGSIHDQILMRPTFFQHFDGVKVDWDYFKQRDGKELKHNAGWLERQQVRIVADFSHGLNFYPNLTLLDTLKWRYEESMKAMEEVLEKMTVLNARDAVIILHRKPENHCDNERADSRFLTGVAEFCRRAKSRGITIHLQHHPHKWYKTAREMLKLIEQVNATNLRFALNVAHAAMNGENLEETLACAGNRLGMILVCAPVKDQFGQIYDAHAPVHNRGMDLSPLSKYQHVPQILDADYSGQDVEYLDCAVTWGRHKKG